MTILTRVLPLSPPEALKLVKQTDEAESQLAWLAGDKELVPLPSGKLA